MNRTPRPGVAGRVSRGILQGGERLSEGDRPFGAVRRDLSWWALAAVLVVGCKQDAVSPVDDRVPVGLAMLGGNAQLFFPETLLPGQLSVQLVDSVGNAVSRGGVVVNWEVTAGDGAIVGLSDTTSAQGTARAAWTLGSEGVNSARASSPDFTPVEFEARAAPPGPIVFVSNRGSGLTGDEVEGFPGDLFVMNPDGTDVIPLFPRRVFQSLFDPAWTPDGNRILYVREIGRPAGGNPTPIRLGMSIINNNGTGEKALPESGLPPYSVYFQDPAWNPFGHQIIATLEADGEANVPTEVVSGSLHFLTDQGTGAVPFETPLGSARAPSWDVVSLRIAFECTNVGVHICTIGDDGSGFVQLTDGGDDDLDPAWSPDGSQLLFARDSAGGGGIWLVNDDGTGLEQVMVGRASSPSWSPDGSRFVYTLTDGGRFDIWLFDFQTKESVNLTNSRFRDREAAWRR